MTICVKRLVTAVWIMTSGKCYYNIFTSKSGYRRHKEVSRYYMISARHFAVLSSKYKFRHDRIHPKQRNEGLGTKANMISISYLRGSYHLSDL